MAKVWIGRVVSGLVTLVFAASALMKFKGGPELEQGLAHLGLPARIIFPLTILELSCAVIYAIPPTAVLGGVLLTGYIGGAILTHWRVGDPVYVHIVLGLLIWLGLYLRERRLHDVLPLRKAD